MSNITPSTKVSIGLVTALIVGAAILYSRLTILEDRLSNISARMERVENKLDSALGLTHTTAINQ